jgi:hypothetical protein
MHETAMRMRTSNKILTHQLVKFAMKLGKKVYIPEKEYKYFTKVSQKGTWNAAEYTIPHVLTNIEEARQQEAIFAKFDKSEGGYTIEVFTKDEVDYLFDSKHRKPFLLIDILQVFNKFHTKEVA